MGYNGKIMGDESYIQFLSRCAMDDLGTWIDEFGYEMGARIIYLDFNAQIYNVRKI